MGGVREKYRERIDVLRINRSDNECRAKAEMANLLANHWRLS